MILEAMKHVLVALEQHALHHERGCVYLDPAAATLRAAIAEAEKQEPVAMVVPAEYEDGSYAGHRLQWRGDNEANDFPEGTVFYTDPPAAPLTQLKRIGFYDKENKDLRTEIPLGEDEKFWEAVYVIGGGEK